MYFVFWVPPEHEETRPSKKNGMGEAWGKKKGVQPSRKRLEQMVNVQSLQTEI